jgi:chromosome segregation ATPase
VQAVLFFPENDEPGEEPSTFAAEAARVNVALEQSKRDVESLRAQLAGALETLQVAEERQGRDEEALSELRARLEGRVSALEKGRTQGSADGATLDRLAVVEDRLRGLEDSELPASMSGDGFAWPDGTR